MLERYWTPNAPYLDGVPFEGRGLDPSRPEVYLITAAGLVTTGAHRYKIAWITASGTTLCGDYSRLITTDTASTGQVAIVKPLFPGGTAAPTFPTNSSGWNIYRTEAGGSTYKLLNAAPLTTQTVYIDNLADASLGAAEPGSNTSVTMNDPTLLSTSVSALTNGSTTDYLIAYFLMQYRWTLLSGASNNAMVLVPGAWTTTGGTTTYKWPHVPQGREWDPSATASSTITIPSYSSDWEAMRDAIWIANSVYIDVQINLTHAPAVAPPSHFITVTPEGGTVLNETVLFADRDLGVPLTVCKMLLTAVHDPDWF